MPKCLNWELNYFLFEIQFFPGQILNPIIGLWLCPSTSQFYLFHHANQIISLPQSNQFGCHSQNWLHPPHFPPISQPSPIRTFLGSLESSHQGLSNGSCPIQMRPANENAPTPVHSPSSNLLFPISSQPIIQFSFANKQSYSVFLLAIQWYIYHSKQVTTQWVILCFMLSLVSLITNQWQQL